MSSVGVDRTESNRRDLPNSQPEWTLRCDSRWRIHLLSGSAIWFLVAIHSSLYRISTRGRLVSIHRSPTMEINHGWVDQQDGDFVLYMSSSAMNFFFRWGRPLVRVYACVDQGGAIVWLPSMLLLGTEGCTRREPHDVSYVLAKGSSTELRCNVTWCESRNCVQHAPWRRQFNSFPCSTRSIPLAYCCRRHAEISLSRLRRRGKLLS